jgi:uncharacterized protein (DUF302 family)
MKVQIPEKMGIERTVPCDVEEAIKRVTASLKEQGFGVLTEINVDATLKAKLDVDFPRYHILGACNPPFAHEALLADPMAGLLMPCNVLVFAAEEGQTRLVGFDPRAMVAAFERPELATLAEAIAGRMKAAIDAA